MLAVGGGSVIDCSKAIAAAACYDGDAWDLITFAAPIEKALPVFTVLTAAATGSEMNSGAVISNPQTNEKMGFMSEHLMPKASILDPTYTFTVPKSQTAAGTADILSHLLVQYFVSESTFMTDLLVESVIKTVIKYAPVAIAEPENYEARAQLRTIVFSSSSALSTFPFANFILFIPVSAYFRKLTTSVNSFSFFRRSAIASVLF